jgi:multisubunit Na+/H+ antiporter MnhF subunit
MDAPLHPVASHHLPSFITPPGETDTLLVITAIILAASVIMFGLVFFRLHSLPERVAHGSHKLQFEIVAVLCLLSLLTHIHAFWVVGLLLALIDIPDFSGWLNRMAGAVERIAGPKPADGAADGAPQDSIVDAKQAETAASTPHETRFRSVKRKEPTHA